MVRFHNLFYLIILCGCTVGPKYRQPETEIPCEWHSKPTEGMRIDQPIDNFLWWDSLNDPILNSLIQRTAQGNLDLRIAASRILEARTIGKAKTGDLYPHIDASLSAGHAYNKNSILDSVLKHAIPDDCKKSNKLNTNFFEIGFDVNWEIDLFGMTAHEIKAQAAQIESSQENFYHMWVTLSAEVAKTYIELRGFQQKLALINQNIEAQRDFIRLTKGLLKSGFINIIDLLQAQEVLSSLIAQRPLIELSIDISIHRLSVLIGLCPCELFEELTEPIGLPCLPDEKPIGLPSELLRRRPDIRRAERDLATATEKIGSAVAALFPRLSLNGFIGDINSHLPSLFQSGSNTWFASPQLLAPIFNSRLLLQDVKYNEIKTCQALLEYEKTVLQALEEAENAIASFGSEWDRTQYLIESKNSIHEAYALTLNLYEKGMKNYLDVLIINRSRLATEEACIQSQVNLILRFISLYKALGGEWVCN